MELKERGVIATGAAGFIGTHLVRALWRRGIVPAVYDNCERGRFENLAGTPATGYFCDLAETVPAWPVGAVVFALAAKVAGIQYNAAHHYRMMQRNLAIALNTVEAARRCKASLVVYVSTACVYGHDVRVPTKELWAEPFNPEPTNRGYATAKWVGEQLVRALHKEHGIPAVIVRLYNAIGEGDYYDHASSHVTPALIRRVMEGEDPLYVWGSGDQTRSFVDARDIAKALVLLAECDKAHDAKPINIGHEKEVTMRELACRVAEACGKPDLRIVCDTTKPDGHPRRAPDVTRLRDLLGWVPDTPLAVTLRECVEEFREGRARLE